MHELEKVIDEGRAIAELFGRERTKIQGPWVTPKEFFDTLTGDGPRLVMPQTEMDGDDALESQVDEIVARHRAGEKPTPIARAVLGYANSRTVDQVRDVIAKYDNDDNDSDDNDDKTGDF